MGINLKPGATSQELGAKRRMMYTRESVMALMEEKEKLEQKLEELWQVLRTVGVAPGLGTRLTYFTIINK